MEEVAYTVDQLAARETFARLPQFVGAGGNHLIDRRCAGGNSIAFGRCVRVGAQLVGAAHASCDSAGMGGEETYHRLLVVHREAVRVGADEELSALVGGAQDVVEVPDLGVGFAQAATVEEAILLPQQDHRIRRAGDDEVGHFQAGAEYSGRILFAIGGDLVLEIGGKGGDKATGRRHREARLHRPQPGRHRAAARVAGEAHARTVYLGPR